MSKFVAFAALLAFLLSSASAYRILCPYPANSRSHFIVPDALFRGLAAKGHEVTVISAFPPEQPIPNYRHITLELVTDHDHIMQQFMKKPGAVGISFETLETLARVTIDETRGMLNNPEVQKMISEETFDLVIMEFIGEPHIGLAGHFNCPIILFASVKPTYRILELLGNPIALSYVKNTFFQWADLNQFTDRTKNFIFYFFEKAVYAYFEWKYSAFHDKQFPSPKYPSFNEILENNVAAAFVTHHFSQGGVRPLVPGIIEISGIQMTETASLLPDALQAWMNQSTNGVIFFSLGSNLKVSALSSDMFNAIVNVFKTIKLNVLWKSDVATIPGLPKNVRLEKWVSQVDVLHHQNTKLFITHGGFGSISEAKFYGVPVLVIPMFGDQIPNANLILNEGWGVVLPYEEFSEEHFSNSLNEVLDNPEYSNRAKYESMLFRDRPITPLETGIYWTEYIIRHKGARHMRLNATQLNWFQLHSIDVIAFLSALLIIWLYISYRILKCLVKKIFRSKEPKTKIN